MATLFMHLSFISDSYQSIENNEFSIPQHMLSHTKFEASGILKTLNSLEIGILITVWRGILQRFNSVNKILQKVTIDLVTVISMYDSVIQYFNDLKDCFDHYEQIDKTKYGINEYKTKRKNKNSQLEKVI